MTFALEAITVVVNISSAIPLAILPTIFAVAGAINIRSAHWAREICFITILSLVENRLSIVGFPERVEKVKG